MDPQLRTITVAHPLLKTGCSLGEGIVELYVPACLPAHRPRIGPLYDPRTSTLHFVDIERNKVCTTSHVV